MAMVKTVFFDIDGTLYEEKNAKIAAEIAVARVIADEAKIDFKDAFEVFLKSKKGVAKSLRGSPEQNDRCRWYADTLHILNVSTLDPIQLSGKYWEIMVGEIRPYPDLLAVLPELSRDYHLWAITDELADVQKKKLRALDLAKHFKGVISSSNTGFVKPDVRLFEYALREAKTTKDGAVMVGDDPRKDIKGANNAGITSIMFKRGKFFFYPAQGDEMPKYAIEDYLALPSVLREITLQENP